jgi:hypothetical protein
VILHIERSERHTRRYFAARFRDTNELLSFESFGLKLELTRDNEVVAQPLPSSRETEWNKQNQFEDRTAFHPF